jgi:hypothetical protein
LVHRDRSPDLLWRHAIDAKRPPPLGAVLRGICLPYFLE